MAALHPYICMYRDTLLLALDSKEQVLPENAVLLVLVVNPLEVRVAKLLEHVSLDEGAS